MYWPRDRKSRGWIIRKGIHPRLWRSDSELNALLSRRDLTPAEAREADRILGDIEAQPPLPPGPTPPLDVLEERRWHGFLDRRSFTPSSGSAARAPGATFSAAPSAGPSSCHRGSIAGTSFSSCHQDQNRRHKGNKMTWKSQSSSSFVCPPKAPPMTFVCSPKAPPVPRIPIP